MRLPSEFRAVERWVLNRQMTIMLAVSIVFTIPPLILGNSIDSTEGRVHAMMIDMVTRQVFAGDLYPTALPDANGGLGSPALHFLGPLPYYVALPLAWMSPFDSDGAIRLATLLGITLFLSGLTARLWLRRLFGRRAAFWGAMIYMLVPFHVTFGLVIRQDYPMMGAVALLPFILYALHRVRDDRPFGFLLLAGSTTALLLTQHVFALCFAPFLLFYTLLVTLYTDRSDSLKRIVPAILLGVFAAGFHIAPQLLLQEHVSIGIARWLDFDETRQMLISFPLSLSTPNDLLGFFLIAFFIYLGRVGGNISEWDDLSDREVERSIPWKLFTFIAYSFYCIPALALLVLQSYSISPLFLIDATYGCLTLFMLSATMLISGALNHGRLTREDPLEFPVTHRTSWNWDNESDVAARLPETARMIVVHSGVLIIVAASILVMYNVIAPFQWSRRVNMTEEQRWRLAPVEYLTRWSRQSIPLSENALRTFVRETKDWEKDKTIVKGRATIEVRNQGSESVRIVSDAPEGTVVDLHRFYFFDQRLDIDSGIGSIGPSPNHGLIRLRIPEGRRIATITSGMTTSGLRGMVISIVAVLTIGAVSVVEQRRYRR